jgi:hypothetical protein
MSSMPFQLAAHNRAAFNSRKKVLLAKRLSWCANQRFQGRSSILSKHEKTARTISFKNRSVFFFWRFGIRDVSGKKWR